MVAIVFCLLLSTLFFKYPWVVPLKQKDSKSVADAFDVIFTNGRKPSKLHADKGKEFVNASQQKIKRLKNTFLC